MCLYVDDELTSSVRTKLEEDGKLIGWKELRVFEGA